MPRSLQAKKSAIGAKGGTLEAAQVRSMISVRTLFPFVVQGVLYYNRTDTTGLHNDGGWG
jgi:hypothetical protein